MRVRCADNRENMLFAAAHFCFGVWHRVPYFSLALFFYTTTIGKAMARDGKKSIWLLIGKVFLYAH